MSSKDPGNICYLYCYGEGNAGIKPRTLYILDKFFVFCFLSYKTISPNLMVLVIIINTSTRPSNMADKEWVGGLCIGAAQQLEL